jgi:hypothetical protein
MPFHKVYLWQPGSIPGFGMFPGNTVVEIDDETNALLGQSPIFPGLPQEAPPDALSSAAPSDSAASSSASAASAASSEADAAVLPDLSSSEPTSTPLRALPVLDLPVNGG